MIFPVVLRDQFVNLDKLSPVFLDAVVCLQGTLQPFFLQNNAELKTEKYDFNLDYHSKRDIVKFVEKYSEMTGVAVKKPAKKKPVKKSPAKNAVKKAPATKSAENTEVTKEKTEKKTEKSKDSTD